MGPTVLRWAPRWEGVIGGEEGGGGPVLKCGMQGGAYGSSEWASGSEGDALGASEGGVPTGPC